MGIFHELIFFTKDMAMDLGTANTLIYIRGEGIVLNEPSVVAFHKKTEKVLAVGKEAKNYLGRTPKNITALRPLKDGVIADFTVTKEMISHFFLKVQKMNRFFKPTVVICVPSGVTQVEKRAVVDAAEEVGVGKVYLIEETMAAAIGANLDIEANRGQMIIDIGGGTTEVAVLNISSVVYSNSVRVAGDELNEAIIRHIVKRHQTLVGENSAEKCKIEIGSAYPVEGLPREYKIIGKDIVSNAPKEIHVNPEEIRKAMEEPVKAMIDAIKRALEKTPPELITDVYTDGMYLAGGGGLLKGLNTLIEKETEIRCNLTDNPLTAIVKGSGMALENIKKYTKVFIN